MCVIVAWPISGYIFSSLRRAMCWNRPSRECIGQLCQPHYSKVTTEYGINFLILTMKRISAARNYILTGTCGGCPGLPGAGYYMRWNPSQCLWWLCCVACSIRAEIIVQRAMTKQNTWEALKYCRIGRPKVTDEKSIPCHVENQTEYVTRLNLLIQFCSCLLRIINYHEQRRVHVS